MAYFAYGSIKRMEAGYTAVRLHRIDALDIIILGRELNMNRGHFLIIHGIISCIQHFKDVKTDQWTSHKTILETQKFSTAFSYEYPTRTRTNKFCKNYVKLLIIY